MIMRIDKDFQQLMDFLYSLAFLEGQWWQKQRSTERLVAILSPGICCYIITSNSFHFWALIDREAYKYWAGIAISIL